MATPSTLILTALQLIGDKAPGDTLTTAEQPEYLSRLNMMMESWDNDGLICYASVTDTKALTAGIGTYTIGTGGDINTNWPTKIEVAWTVDGSNVSRQIDNFVGSDEWAEIILKQLGNTYPNTLWYDNAYPLGNINLWPLPVAGLTLYLLSYGRLQSFAAIGTTVSLPPGYEMAITTNLAIFLAAGQVEVPAAVAKLAQESLARLKTNNVQVPTLNLPDALTEGNDLWQYPLPVW